MTVCRATSTAGSSRIAHRGLMGPKALRGRGESGWMRVLCEAGCQEALDPSLSPSRTRGVRTRLLFIALRILQIQCCDVRNQRPAWIWMLQKILQCNEDIIERLAGTPTVLKDGMVAAALLAYVEMIN